MLSRNDECGDDGTIAYVVLDDVTTSRFFWAHLSRRESVSSRYPSGRGGQL